MTKQIDNSTPLDYAPPGWTPEGAPAAAEREGAELERIEAAARAVKLLTTDPSPPPLPAEIEAVLAKYRTQED